MKCIAFVSVVASAVVAGLFMQPCAVPLSAIEAEQIRGSVVLPDMRCNYASGDCDLYNWTWGGLSTCPGDLCEDCSIDNPWDTCVSSVGRGCDWQGFNNDCGKVRQGVCVGNVCWGLTATEADCADAPKCDNAY